MTVDELHRRLFILTPSERFHLDHPGTRSKRYDHIDIVRRDGRKLYVFKFDTIMNNHNFSMHKESRYARIPPHIHTVIEIMYVYSGSCTQIINGERVVLGEGDACLVDADTVHEILPLGNDDIVITLDVRKQFFTEGFLAQLSSQGVVARFLMSSLAHRRQMNGYLVFARQEDVELRGVIQKLFCEYYDSGLCSDEIIDAYLIILLSYLFRIYQKHAARFANHGTAMAMPAVILSYIEDNCVTATLRSTAKAFGFHPNYLSYYIKKNTGKTFKDIIIDYRMALAASYLHNTDMSVVALAHELGYSNLTFFYEKFKKSYGMSPREYRMSSPS